jgi:hypothetical protein
MASGKTSTFRGPQERREQLIATLDLEAQQHARNLIKIEKNADKLIAITLSDLMRSADELKKNESDQFMRRTMIRVLAAAVEATLYCLKQLALESGLLVGFKFSEDEIVFLREEKTDPKTGKRQRFPNFRENLKRAFDLMAKAHKVNCSTDFGTAGYNALCETFALRDRLMHPKNYMTFCVSDDESKKARVAAGWLHDELTKLLSECSQQLAQKK